ncbi:MAG: DUF2252 family protein [Streptosporangiaceae bacterium]
MANDGAGSQAQSRVPELVPIRHGQMLVSPFTYYRGAALPMAADLAGTRFASSVRLCAASSYRAGDVACRAGGEQPGVIVTEGRRPRSLRHL